MNGLLEASWNLVDALTIRLLGGAASGLDEKSQQELDTLLSITKESMEKVRNAEAALPQVIPTH